MKKYLLCFLVIPFLFSSTEKTQVDLVLYHARIYTVDSSFAVAQAMAISNGRIVAVGDDATIASAYEAKKSVDTHGAAVYPGFIDAHCHFVSYGLGLQSLDLTGTKSWKEVGERLKIYLKAHSARGRWIIGKGWDQNDWRVHEFPSRELLDSLCPDNPVFLERIDGHAAIVNQVALDLASVHVGQVIAGGQIEQKNKKLTGILIDNAVQLVALKIPAPSELEIRKGLLDAQKNCFAVGLTTLDDCGLDFDMVNYIESLQRLGELKMRLFVMLSDARKNYEYLFAKGKIKTERLNVRSFKLFADGALGSRGACLLKPYIDKPGWQGFLLSDPAHFDSVAAILFAKGYQMCTHCIGDSANRTILHVYAKYLKQKNDRRWRIEHAQVVDDSDFHLFGEYNIVPSVQPTHATSDMYWAGRRLGNKRLKGAYAYNQLLQQNGWITLGTDFPVEEISPLKTFYAAVIRKDSKGWPTSGFQIMDAITRQQAIRGMTIWAAKSNFEEQEKGSLEKGKMADFVLLDADLMTASEADLLNVKVLSTFINGEQVYGR